jgi:integrase
MRQKVRREGHDPHRARKQAAAAAAQQKERDRLTLEVLVNDWQRIHLAHRSPRYQAEAVRALKHAFARQWEQPAEALDRAAVVRALDDLQRPSKPAKADDATGGATRGQGQAIAARTAAYGRACYAWAVKRVAVPGNPFLALPVPASAPARDRVLTDDELAAIWRATEKASAPFGTLVRLLMLTGQRREEVASMQWAEIADDLSAWTIPGVHIKNGKPHLVPLSGPVQDILRPLIRGEDLVFRGRVGTAFSGWSACKADLDKDSGVTGWRIHDLRRTLATGLQRLGVRLEVTEAVLNHISGSRSGIVGVYQRHDWKAEKAAALDAWAAHLQAVLKDAEAPDNVVQMRRA